MATVKNTYPNAQQEAELYENDSTITTVFLTKGNAAKVYDLRKKSASYFPYQLPEELIIQQILIQAQPDPTLITGHIINTIRNERVRKSRIYLELNREEVAVWRQVRREVKEQLGWTPTVEMVINAIVGTQRLSAREFSQQIRDNLAQQISTPDQLTDNGEQFSHPDHLAAAIHFASESHSDNYSQDSNSSNTNDNSSTNNNSANDSHSNDIHTTGGSNGSSSSINENNNRFSPGVIVNLNSTNQIPSTTAAAV
jgi:hypothetical protein